MGSSTSSFESFEGQSSFVVQNLFLLWQSRGGRDDHWCRVAIAPTLLINPKSKLCQSLTLKGFSWCVLCQEPPFLLSILIKCGSQGSSSLIMKGEMGAPEPRRATGQSIFILVHAIIKDSAAANCWNVWSCPFIFPSAHCNEEIRAETTNKNETYWIELSDLLLWQRTECFLTDFCLKAAWFYFLLIDWQHVVDGHVNVLLFYRKL